MQADLLRSAQAARELGGEPGGARALGRYVHYLIPILVEGLGRERLREEVGEIIARRDVRDDEPLRS